LASALERTDQLIDGLLVGVKLPGERDVESGALLLDLLLEEGNLVLELL